MRQLIFACFVSALSWVASAQTTEGERFNKWLEVNWEETLQREPILATSLGDPRYNARLVNTLTAQWRADNKAYVERQLRELKGFNLQALNAKDRLSYRILKRDLEQTLEGMRYPGWMLPLSQRGGIPNFMAQMGSGKSIQPFRTTKDYDDWMARLTLAVPLFDAMIANLRAGASRGVTHPVAIVDKVLPQLQAHVVEDPEKSIFWGPIKSFPEGVSAADRERITSQMRALIKDKVSPAYQRLHAYVRDEYRRKARTSTAWSQLPNGKAWYAYLTRVNTTTDLAPDAIHDMGLKEVARILAEMEAVKREVKFEGDLKAFFKHLQDDPKYYYTGQDLLAGYRALQTPQRPAAQVVRYRAQGRL